MGEQKKSFCGLGKEQASLVVPFNRGVTSIDLMLAIVGLLFAYNSMQGLLIVLTQSQESFGAGLQVKANAISLGSQANAFFALIPNASTSDFALADRFVRLFRVGDVTPDAAKVGVWTSVTLNYNGTTYNSQYPAALDVKYDPVNKKLFK